MIVFMSETIRCGTRLFLVDVLGADHFGIDCVMRDGMAGAALTRRFAPPPLDLRGNAAIIEIMEPDTDNRQSSDPVVSDPPPTAPEKPLGMDCCESGCDRCVFDIYADDLAHYEAALAAWRQRHRVATSEQSQPP